MTIKITIKTTIKITAKFALLALMLGLAGCVRFEPKPLAPAERATTLESRSLTNAALKKFLEKQLRAELAPWPPEAWSLDMLTLAAFYYQPELEVARAHWRVVQAGVKTAG